MSAVQFGSYLGRLDALRNFSNVGIIAFAKHNFRDASFKKWYDLFYGSSVFFGAAFFLKESASLTSRVSQYPFFSERKGGHGDSIANALNMACSGSYVAYFLGVRHPIITALSYGYVAVPYCTNILRKSDYGSAVEDTEDLYKRLEGMGLSEMGGEDGVLTNLSEVNGLTEAQILEQIVGKLRNPAASLSTGEERVLGALRPRVEARGRFYDAQNSLDFVHFCDRYLNFIPTVDGQNPEDETENAVRFSTEFQQQFSAQCNFGDDDENLTTRMQAFVEALQDISNPQAPLEGEGLLAAVTLRTRLAVELKEELTRVKGKVLKDVIVDALRAAKEIKEQLQNVRKYDLAANSLVALAGVLYSASMIFDKIPGFRRLFYVFLGVYIAYESLKNYYLVTRVNAKYAELIKAGGATPQLAVPPPEPL